VIEVYVVYGVEREFLTEVADGIFEVILGIGLD